MKKTTLIIVLAILLYVLAVQAFALPVKHHVATSTPLTVQQITALTLPNVISISVKDSSGNLVKTGSGVVIGPNEVATCYHVITGAATITVNFTNGRSVTAYGIAAANKAIDVAILNADTNNMDGLTMEFKKPALGSTVVAIGSPEGLNGTVSTGIVSGVRNDTSRTLIQTSAPISHGSSGGALVDDQGHLIGITSDIIPDGENLNFAISSLDVGGVATGPTASFADLRDALMSASDDSGPATTAGTSTPSTVAKLDYTLKPLIGVVGVSIVIEDLNDDAVSDGLSKDAIETAVTNQLQKNNVPVDSSTDFSPGHGYLYVRESTLKLDDGTYCYSITANFNEKMVMHRDTPIDTMGATWDDGYIGYVGKDDMVSTITQETTNMVGKFAKEWTSENGK